MLITVTETIAFEIPIYSKNKLLNKIIRYFKIKNFQRKLRNLHKDSEIILSSNVKCVKNNQQ